MSAKAKSCRAHFKKRVLERLNLVVNRDDIHEVQNTIKRGNTKIIISQSNSIKIHRMKIKGIETNVVYNKVQGAVVTVLTDEMISTLLDCEGFDNEG